MEPFIQWDVTPDPSGLLDVHERARTLGPLFVAVSGARDGEGGGVKEFQASRRDLGRSTRRDNEVESVSFFSKWHGEAGHGCGQR